VKAAREAKRATSWLNPDSEYENALGTFVASLLDTPGQSAFLHDFAKLSELTSYFGHLNSLAQIVLKLTSPGVPDIYQGNESSVFSLVDPDNRQPVNFDEAERRLGTLQQRLREEPRTKLVEDLLAQGYGGSGKLYVTFMLLTLRRQRPQLFALGRYIALTVSGEYKEHVLAFVRTHESQRLIVIVSRWACKLMTAVQAPPVGDVWGDTRIELDIEVGGEWPAAPLTELFSGRPVEIQAERPCIRAADAFASLPFAVLMTGQ
jgi:(1->4)-alpha-D-glucan 1-alpha-D-glucosylmutase